jgi:anti-anti-sigma factor
LIEPVSAALNEALVTAPDDLSALPGLSVTADPGPRACRLRLIGRLDADTVPLFTACLTSWIERGMTHLVVDLTEVSAVDAAGTSAIAHATHHIGRCGGSMHVIAHPELARDSLATCGLDFIAPNEAPGPTTDTVIGVRHVG